MSGNLVMGAHIARGALMLSVYWRSWKKKRETPFGKYEKNFKNGKKCLIMWCFLLLGSLTTNSTVSVNCWTSGSWGGCPRGMELLQGRAQQGKVSLSQNQSQRNIRMFFVFLIFSGGFVVGMVLLGHVLLTHPWTFR